MAGLSDFEKEKLKIFFKTVENGSELCMNIAKLLFPKIKIDSSDGKNIIYIYF